MRKKSKIGIVVIMTLFVCFGVSVFTSSIKFGVDNPFTVIRGLYQVSFTDTEYVELQQYPKVIIAKPMSNDLLIEYMENQGYSENEEGRMGAILEFTQTDHKKYIDFSANGLYSLWKWRE